MSTTLRDIRTALIKPIIDNDSFDIEFSYENYPTENSIEAPLGQAIMLPVQPFQACLGTNGTDRHNGVFQINLFYPDGYGDIPALEKADEIATVYKSGAVFSYNNVNVTIESVGNSVAFNENGSYFMPISINYYSFIGRE